MSIKNLNYEILKLITSLSGYMHDFGKANALFQSKIRGEGDLADIIRHEFLSFHIALRLVEEYEKEIKDDEETLFITKDKWNHIFNDLHQCSKDKLDYTFFKKSLQNLIQCEQNDYYNFKINDDVNPITLCILLAILTHHKLPSSSINYDYARMKSAMSFPLRYYNLNHINDIQEKDINRLKKNIQLHSNYYISDDLQKQINEGFKKVYSEYQSIIKQKGFDKSMFFKSFSIVSRIFLIMSDHHVSSIKKCSVVIDKKDENSYLKTYANTNRDINDPTVIPTFNQTLDEHLLEVGDNTTIFLEELSHIEKNLPHLSADTISKIMQETSREDFKWQDQAVKFIQENKKDQPTLILNMGTTGSGKTRMNVKALGALNKERLRFTSVFNLKSLTLQTGNAYKNQLKLKNKEISTLIGDKTYLEIQNLDFNNEELKLDNDEQSTEIEYLIEGNFQAVEDWKSCPSFIKDKNKNGYNVADFIGVPVLVSTIDFCIHAGDLSQGTNHNNAFLRIMTSDLIIDEIDSYEPEMLESVLRLITMSAMNQRNIVISSATLSKNYIIMIKKAFEHGIELGNVLYGLKHHANIICISNLIDAKKIISINDIEDYIHNLCLKYSDNKQKLAEILYIKPYTKENHVPSVFKAIEKLHINHNQSLHDKKFSFGLIRVGKIKHAVEFAEKYIKTNFSNMNKYAIANEEVEIKFLTYHSNLLNSQRFILENFLDDSLNQNSGFIENDFVLKTVEQSKAKHVIFIVIATPVEEIGRDHDFHWAIIEPSSIQSIIQTAGRVNRHRKVIVNNPNIYILQYNLSYYQKECWKNIFFTKPGLEMEENKYPQDINQLLPWNNKPLYITSELRYSSVFAHYDDKSIFNILSKLNYKFENNSNNHWFRMEYYLCNKLRVKDSDTITYVVDSIQNKFYQKDEDRNGNSKMIDSSNNIHKNALCLPVDTYQQKIINNHQLQEWSNQTDVSIYTDKQKEQIRYNKFYGFYFENKN